MKPVSPVIAGVPDVKIAEHQDEYNTLSAIITDDGYVISRWRLTWRERLTVLFVGNVYLSCLTFGRPVQPVNLEVDPPHVGVAPGGDILHYG
jgi:hypothetical protein